MRLSMPLLQPRVGPAPARRSAPARPRSSAWWPSRRSLRCRRARPRAATPQLKLATVTLELSELQTAPFQAHASTGGSPVQGAPEDRCQQGQDRGHARGAGPRRAAGGAARGSRPAARELRRRRQDLRARRLRRGLRPRGRPTRRREARRVAGAATGLLDAASREYDRRASRAQLQATVGSIALILLLLFAFGLLYRRAARARGLAERLVVENAALLALSRQEALARLADRPPQPPRADQRPLERAPAGDRRGAADPRALRPRRLQAVQRHLRPPGRRRAADPPRRAPRDGARRASAPPTGWAATSSASSHRSARRASSEIPRARRRRAQRDGRRVRDRLLLRGRAGARPRRPPSSTRCISPTSACTSTRPGGPRRAGSPPTSCSRSSASAARSSTSTSATSPRLTTLTAERLGLPDARGHADRAGRRAARRRQDRDPRHDPQQAGQARRRGVGASCAATR